MTIGIMPARPPYIEFEQRAEEDRDATIKEGHIVYKDVDYVIVRQLGSVNTVEKRADEWLSDQRALASRGRLPADWPAAFQKKYEEYKNGLAPTVDGTSIRLWPAASKADIENCVRVKVLTVEDLAAANEETLQRIGMGSRALQQKARAWLDTHNTGAEELAALRAKTESQEDTIKTLLQKVTELEAAVGEQRPTRGRAA